MVTPFEGTLAHVRQNAELKELVRTLACDMRNYSVAKAAESRTETSAINMADLRRFLLNEMQFPALRVLDIATEFFNNNQRGQ